ncbi:hypothetical protein ACFE04_009646 [Oxalis oulophora]
MKGIEWVFSQLLSKLSVSSSSMPLSTTTTADVGATNQQQQQHQRDNQASTANLQSPAALSSSVTNEENGPRPSTHHLSTQHSHQSDHVSDENKLDPLQKVKNLRIKFLRILGRLKQSQDNLLVAKVLYRLHLASLIRAEESDLNRINLENNKARSIAREQETAGHPDLNFSITILVLGKTGVGKSATINSIFDQPKTETNAFRPGTDLIREVTGIVNGIRVTFIDTPGFLPASINNMRRNKKILHSVKRFIRKSPPDIVLYFERLDHVNMGYSDFPILKLVTDVFGSAIWFNTILVLTHSSSNLPEGPNGFPVNYDSYVRQCINLLQSYVHVAVSDSKLENPVLLVENHPSCKRNLMGEKILPNGQVWKSEFLLLCLCTKVLGDANSFLKFCGSIELGPTRDNRQPSLPHLLSSFLRRRSTPCQNEGENDVDEILHLLSETEGEDEYDQLPLIRILTKSQFEKMNKTQKKAYLDELDYRETLYLKKQLKEECQRRKESKISKDGDSDEHESSPEPVQLPDMAIPLSFDSDYPLHRYRCIVTGDQWLTRPVLDPHGWDHDVGFDGINLESAGEVRKNTFASVSGQISKDKQDFTIQSECAAAYVNPLGGPSYSIGMDVQSSGKDLIYTVYSNAKLKNLKNNVTDCGVSLTSFGNKFYAGAKVEDSILVGKRLKFMMNAGTMSAPGQVAAYGGSFEAVLRSRDHPVRNDHISLTMSAISFKKEMVLGGGLQSEFRLSHGTKVAINTNLNNRNVGQVSVKLSSSEHMEIGLVAIFAFFRALACRKGIQRTSMDALESG